MTKKPFVDRPKSQKSKKPSTKARKLSKKRPKAAVALCPICHCPAHVGDSEEALSTLDPEAAVFYDRDVAEVDCVRGLCGPRFRLNTSGLHAHYGSPAGKRYVVFFWEPTVSLWKLIIDTALSEKELRRRQDALDEETARRVARPTIEESRG